MREHGEDLGWFHVQFQQSGQLPAKRGMEEVSFLVLINGRDRA